MFAFIFALLATLLTFATAVPVERVPVKVLQGMTTPVHSKAQIQDCLGDNFVNSFKLTNIAIFTPAKDSGATKGHISFNFLDSNVGLVLPTVCVGEVVNGEALFQGFGYLRCENELVSFKLTEGNKISIGRSFQDDWYVVIIRICLRGVSS